MKKLIVLAMVAAVSAPAFADQQMIDALIGGALGGGGARHLYKGNDNSKRNLITAAGALGGAWVGSKIGDDSGRRHDEQMQMEYQRQQLQRQDMQERRSRYSDQMYSPQQPMMERQVQPINVSYNQPMTVSQPTRSRSARYDDDQDVDVDVTVNLPPVRANYQSNYNGGQRRSSSGCDTSSYNDPEAARAYCAGRAEYLRNAYERGARGR